MMYTKCTYCT